MEFEKLAAPFDPQSIKWRVGSTNKDKTRGIALAYIDSRDVMDRLDVVAGPGNWRDKYQFDGARTLCTIEILLDGVWVGKTDGAGDTDIEGEKGGLSDAFKRAAVKWGIGRYLYRLDSPWVELDKYRRIEKHEYDRLARLLSPGGGDSQMGKAHLPEANQSPGVVLKDAMRGRFVGLGIEPDSDAINLALNEIILVDLALEKTLPVLRENMEAIKARITAWKPDEQAA